MFKRILIQLIFLKIIFTTDPNCSKIIDGVCSVCNFNFRLEEGKCIPIKPSKYSTQQKQRTLNSAEKKYEMQSQRPRYSRKLQSLNFANNPARKRMQLVWNKGILGLNTGEAAEEYLQGPNGSIAAKIVNDLLKIINQHNAAYSNFPPIVLRTGRDYILTDVKAPVKNISFSACTCNQPISKPILQNIREIALQINIQSIRKNFNKESKKKDSKALPPQRFYAFDPNLAISITLIDVGQRFFADIFQMLTIFNQQRKTKEDNLIIVNETGYKIYPNNTANVKRFFFLTEKGSSNLTNYYYTINEYLSSLAEIYEHEFGSSFPGLWPTIKNYCRIQDFLGRFCESCFPGFNYNNGQCVKQDSHCQRIFLSNGVCIQCDLGYYRQRSGTCLKANVSEFCLSIYNLTGQCTRCQQPYKLFNGNCEQDKAHLNSTVDQSAAVSPNNDSPQQIPIIDDYQKKLLEHEIAVIRKIAELDDLTRGEEKFLQKQKQTQTSNQVTNSSRIEAPNHNSIRESDQPVSSSVSVGSSPIDSIIFPQGLQTVTLSSVPARSNLLRKSVSPVQAQLPKPTVTCIYCEKTGT